MKKLRYLCCLGMLIGLLLPTAWATSAQDVHLLCEKYDIIPEVEQAYRTYCTQLSEQNKIPMLSLETFAQEWDASIPLESYVNTCVFQNQSLNVPYIQESPTINLYPENFTKKDSFSSIYENKPIEWWNNTLEPTKDFSNDIYKLTNSALEGDILNESIGETTLSGHTAMVIGRFYSSKFEKYYIRVIEAIPKTGVSYGIFCDERFQKEATFLDRPSSATLSQMQAASAFVKKQLGKPYGLFTSELDERRPSWYCSILVYAAYYNQGVYLLDPLDTDAVPTPWALHNGNVFTLVRYIDVH